MHFLMKSRQNVMKMLLSFSISLAASSVFIARENSYEDELNQSFAKCSVRSPRAPQEKLSCSANLE